MPVKRRKRVVVKPISHNGCHTCRTRHVKCDEGRPSCERCRRGGWCCDFEGKQPAPEPLPAHGSHKSLVAIAPRENPPRSERFCEERLDQATAISRSNHADVLLLPPHVQGQSSSATLRREDEDQSDIKTEDLRLPMSMGSGYPFQTTDHERYGWSHFQLHTFRVLSEVFLNATWVRAALQTARTTEPVFHAIAALGLAHRSTNYVLDWHLERWDHPANERTTAFALYSRALASLQRLLRDMANIDAMMDAFLITCMLCVCFEGVAGQLPSAMIHASLGRRIMMDYRAGKAAAEVTIGMSSPLLVELSRSFDTLLELDAAPMLLKSAQVANHTADPPAITCIPDRFVDVLEAERHLVSLSTHASRYRQRSLKIAQDRIQASQLPPTSYVVQTLLALCVRRSILSTSGSLKAAVQSTVLNLQRWADAASWLWTLQTASQQSRHLLLLRIRYAHAVLELRLLGDPNDMFLDHYEFDLRDLLSLCEAYVRLTPPYPPVDGQFPVRTAYPGGHCLDQRVIPAVHLVAVKCRQPDVRRRAVRMLATMGRREGLLSSSTVAISLAAIIGLEEREAEALRSEGGGYQGSSSARAPTAAHSIPDAARFADGVLVDRPEPPGTVELWCGRLVPSGDAGSSCCLANVEVRRYGARLDWCGTDEDEIVANLARGAFSTASFDGPFIDGVYAV